MQIFVKTMGGDIHPIDCEESDTIDMIVDKVVDKIGHGLTENEVRLIFEGKDLTKTETHFESTLHDLGITKEATLYLVLKNLGYRTPYLIWLASNRIAKENGPKRGKLAELAMYARLRKHRDTGFAEEYNRPEVAAEASLPSRYRVVKNETGAVTGMVNRMANIVNRTDIPRLPTRVLPAGTEDAVTMNDIKTGNIMANFSSSKGLESSAGRYYRKNTANNLTENPFTRRPITNRVNYIADVMGPVKPESNGGLRTRHRRRSARSSSRKTRRH